MGVARSKHANERALRLAAREGDNAQVAKLVVGKRVKVDARGKHGPTALHRAAMMGHTGTVRLLCDLGAQVNARDERGYTPLHAACSKGLDETIRALCALGAAANAATDSGWTPLHIAAERGHASTVQLLVTELGASVNSADQDGDSPLHCAACQGQDGVILLLGHLGAHLNANNKALRAPVDDAAMSGHASSVLILCELGAIVNVDYIRSILPAWLRHPAVMEDLEAAQCLSKLGHLGPIVASTERGERPLFLPQRLRVLPPDARRELTRWVGGALRDELWCYATLAVLKERHSAYDAFGKIVTQFLVYPKKETRRLLRELERMIADLPPVAGELIQPTPWRTKLARGLSKGTSRGSNPASSAFASPSSAHPSAGGGLRRLVSLPRREQSLLGSPGWRSRPPRRRRHTESSAIESTIQARDPSAPPATPPAAPPAAPPAPPPAPSASRLVPQQPEAAPVGTSIQSL